MNTDNDYFTRREAVGRFLHEVDEASQRLISELENMTYSYSTGDFNPDFVRVEVAEFISKFREGDY